MNFYPDEARNAAELRRFLAADFSADPDALTKYQGLQARDVRNRARIAELEKALERAVERTKRVEKEKAKVEKELTRNERKRRQIRDENADLTRRLGSAHGALNAYRRESARLKDDLQRLRGSKSYRLGKRALDPLGLRSRASQQKALEAAPTQQTTTSASSQVMPTPVTESAAPSGGVIDSAPDPQSPEAPALPRKFSEMSYPELLQWLAEDPCTDSLKAVLTRSWYSEGLITTPAKLLEEHAEIAEQLTGKDAVLPQRILGAHRAKEEGFPIPPRAKGPAYQPERDRVMYCAHSTAIFNTNGYSIRTHGMAKGLAGVHQDLFVVGRPGYPWDSTTDIRKPAPTRHTAELDGVSYVHLPASPLSGTSFDRYILEAADAYVREARLLRPSLIHAASNFWTALPALLAARRLGLPFVYEVRGLWEITEASDKPGWEGTERYAQQVHFETLAAMEADAVLAITEETREELIRRGVSAQKISLAPNAVDTDSYLPLPKDESYADQKQIHTDRPVIGFTGSMVTYEGLHLLLEATALLAEQEDQADEPGFQVVLAGSGRAEESLRTMSQELGIDDRVRFLGRVPNAEIPRLLSLIDIMPLPRLSLPVTEMVSPLKPLEGLSAAKAVVLSEVSPHRVFAGETCDRAVLFPAGDAEALAQVLGSLIADPERAVALGRAGRLWCLDNRTWGHVARSVLTAYGEAEERHDRAVSSRESRTLRSLRVGLVADEFTTSTLDGAVRIVPLDRSSWRDQLPGLDLVFIESAWEGNGGQWHRGIGRYSPEEHRDIVQLLAAAREQGTPSIFWNKEDPVHFNRFVATASLCDHVFTTDAGRIPAYLERGQGTVQSASALPFYAQPKIHNPLPTDRPFDPTFAYAGTYYGDRYAQRSRELSSILTAARPHGLSIYDRQAANPDSPYHFPHAFEPHVKGSLPYHEVLRSYKSHIASLNVNSVADSPSMFSRRVVEIAASGGVVISGPGRGVQETFGSAIPATANHAEWRALFRALSTDPQARLREAWLQMRAVLRSHTVETALTILARTAGLAVAAPSLPSYALVLDSSLEDESLLGQVVDAILAQSVLPAEMTVPASDTETADRLRSAGISVTTDADGLTAQFVGIINGPRSRTWFEDLLLATKFGDWQGLAAHAEGGVAIGDPIANPVDAPRTLWDLVARPVLWRHHSVAQALTATQLTGVELVKPRSEQQAAAATTSAAEAVSASPERHRRIVVAGHDLKFAQPFISSLREAGHTVSLDQWASHTDHDEQQSLELLRTADVIFCEWALGNAEWYSQHVADGQRLVVRVHSQELRRPYLSRIRHDQVAAYIFVGDLIREAAVRSHGVPRERSVVIPNGVEVDALALPKIDGAERTIGLVGILPQSKRLDLALDVLENLHGQGEDYRLRVRGKLPSELPWLKQRPAELQWFEDQFARIEAINAQRPDSVLVEGHGGDMPQWYRNIGVALSVSDFESFHLTIADGAASGALPALLAWPGSDLIYPREWICSTTDQVVERILTAPRTTADLQQAVTTRFAASDVNRQLASLTVG